ncbi:CBS domain-containing protein [Corallococcus llansteffanensis]|uniref:CBS domain-containing protein n=1 Tax=Corallococcus llansteffanensis TaxID=2316731 RepID=A0A3A8P6N5_9BACT|nr:CBS domain-containing protein [Corallococcus llansteffanensis]RKH49085.1 CBS domain-containing protein [Corallococcus llansteffanensis]
MAKQRVMDVMTADVEALDPSDTLKGAAEMMRTLNVGPMPVCEDERLVGIITDRDIVVRAVARGLDVNSTPVSQAMSTELQCVYEDEDISVAAQKMKDERVRRILVTNRDNKLVGIIALGDIAEALGAREGGETLEAVSEPSQPAH